MLNFLPRAIGSHSAPIDPHSLVCEVLRRSGSSWVLDLAGKDQRERMSESSDLVADAQRSVVRAVQSGSLPIYVHILGDPICYRVPLDYFHRRDFGWEDGDEGGWDCTWLCGQLTGLFSNDLPPRLLDQPVFAFDDEAEAWLGSEFPDAPTSAKILAAPSDQARRGGRNNDKHGEPISALTIRLLQASVVDLNRSTGEALRDDLATLYKEAGAAPPSPSNLVGICRGILRTVKAERSKQQM